MGNLKEVFKAGFVFFVGVSFLALLPTVMWFVILSVIAWGLNQSGFTGDFLHYWKYWWCLGVFVLAFIGHVLVIVGECE